MEVEYTDHSHVPPDDAAALFAGVATAVAVLGGGRNAENFPTKLHRILSTRPDLSRIISWQPHGRAWKIHNQKDFVAKVVPEYFQMSKYTSFHRQVNGWGFRRIGGAGDDAGGYYHELFLRGKPHLLKRMQRVAISYTSASKRAGGDGGGGGGKAAKRKRANAFEDTLSIADFEIHPDFYKMALKRPLPLENPPGYVYMHGGNVAERKASPILPTGEPPPPPAKQFLSQEENLPAQQQVPSTSSSGISSVAHASAAAAPVAGMQPTQQAAIASLAHNYYPRCIPDAKIAQRAANLAGGAGGMAEEAAQSVPPNVAQDSAGEQTSSSSSSVYQLQHSQTHSLDREQEQRERQQAAGVQGGKYTNKAPARMPASATSITSPPGASTHQAQYQTGLTTANHLLRQQHTTVAQNYTQPQMLGTNLPGAGQVSQQVAAGQVAGQQVALGLITTTGARQANYSPQLNAAGVNITTLLNTLTTSRLRASRDDVAHFSSIGAQQVPIVSEYQQSQAHIAGMDALLLQHGLHTTSSSMMSVATTTTSAGSGNFLPPQNGAFGTATANGMAMSTHSTSNNALLRNMLSQSQQTSQQQGLLTRCPSLPLLQQNTCDVQQRTLPTSSSAPSVFSSSSSSSSSSEAASSQGSQAGGTKKTNDIFPGKPERGTDTLSCRKDEQASGALTNVMLLPAAAPAPDDQDWNYRGLSLPQPRPLRPTLRQQVSAMGSPSVSSSALSSGSNGECSDEGGGEKTASRARRLVRPAFVTGTSASASLSSMADSASGSDRVGGGGASGEQRSQSVTAARASSPSAAETRPQEVARKQSSSDEDADVFFDKLERAADLL